MRFISPVDPMWHSKMKAVEACLIEDTLVRRYETEATNVGGLPGSKRSFAACSFLLSRHLEEMELALIRKINSQTSFGAGLLPTCKRILEISRQYIRKPAGANGLRFRV